MTARTWYDGAATDLSEDGWARLVPSFLGVGFRVLVTPDPASLEHAEAGVRRLAEVVGAPFDPAAFTHLRDEPAYAEVGGGWERHLVRGLGAPWTRVSPTEPGPDRTGAALALPWPWTDGPAAGLPTISRLAEHQAERELGRVGAGLGLWLDRSGALRASTAGTPLVRLADGRWVRPDAGAWVAAPALVVPALPVSASALAAATALCAVTGLGELTLADALDGRPLQADAPPELSRRRPAPRRTPPG